ncbi:uncharacterized protein LOC131239405 [Magnolia sinica]|uniref:uncharacterized protein LOC131239405 n=1 Tax=Magnolia sinica TaxID=86752 RepID=UPI002658CA2F|nr:uncharacterized protein LOC131239405 [Magnolia sinica]
MLADFRSLVASFKVSCISCAKELLIVTTMECYTGYLFVGYSLMIMLEGAKATTETVDAPRTGASAIKSIQISFCSHRDGRQNVFYRFRLFGGHIGFMVLRMKRSTRKSMFYLFQVGRETSELLLWWN